MGASVKNSVSSKNRSELGAALLEYALTVAIVSLVGIIGVKVVGAKIAQQLSNTSDQLAGCQAGSGDPSLPQCLTSGAD